MVKQSEIEEFLNRRLAATTSQIARFFGKRKQYIEIILKKMYFAGKLKAIEAYEYFPGARTCVRCIYWCLPKYYKRALRWLNRHPLIVAKPKK